MVDSKASDHVKPCDIAKSEAHNRRDEEYLNAINKDKDSPMDGSSFDGNSSSVRNDIAKDGKQISTADYGASSSAHRSEPESNDTRILTKDCSSHQTNEREQRSE